MIPSIMENIPPSSISTFARDDVSKDGMRATYTVREASEILGVNRTTLYRLILAGTVPAFKIGGKVLISRTTIKELMEVE